MSEESDDAEDKNTPFDDVTHWVGNLPRENINSTKRVSKRSAWRKIKSNFFSQELGMEKKSED